MDQRIKAQSCRDIRPHPRARDRHDWRGVKRTDIKIGRGIEIPEHAEFDIVIAQGLKHLCRVAVPDFDSHLRMTCMKDSQCRQDVYRRVGHDPQMTGQYRAGLAEMLGNFVFDIKETLCPVKQSLTRRRHPQPSPIATKQQHVIVLFQPSNLVGQRRLALVGLAGGFRKTAMSSDLMEGSDLGVAHLSDFLIDRSKLWISLIEQIQSLFTHFIDPGACHVC